MQFAFGAGIVFATQLTDATGAAIALPTPIELGVMQEVSVDISWDTKTLYGGNQFPVDAGRGKGKVSGKAKVARLSGALMNTLVFGQGVTTGMLAYQYDTVGTVVATTVTPTVPGSGTWAGDMGVKDANGNPMKRVASAPATGQYSLASGTYTFAAADVGKTVYISYQYAQTTTGSRIDVLNLPMGYAPSFALDLMAPKNGQQLALHLYKCIGSKYSMGTKQDDYMVPEFDFEGFADASGRVFSVSTNE
ncbi:MAG: hypothetical protein JSS57_13475 [Proteobacteria bacterium]|nr:hypothetical protein [Pseudomonadota bacterium]